MILRIHFIPQTVPKEYLPATYLFLFLQIKDSHAAVNRFIRRITSLSKSSLLFLPPINGNNETLPRCPLCEDRFERRIKAELVNVSGTV